MIKASSFSSFSVPWPDPNSIVLSKIDFGVPLAELLKWLDIRDTLLGQNSKKQDITAALALARDCKHPDAEWLTSIFQGKDVSTEEDARNVFLSVENDARALCFAWSLRDVGRNDLSLLRRASEMGNGLACALLSDELQYEDEEAARRLAEHAAAQYERNGFSCLGGWLFKKDSSAAKANYLIAAELGDDVGAERYGCAMDESDVARWIWLGRAALLDDHWSFIGSFQREVERFASGFGSPRNVFLIGRALKDNMDLERRCVFKDPYDFDHLIGPVNQAIAFYDSQIKCARQAVDTWTMVAVRFGVVKDIRILISKLIWDAVFDANYKI